MLPGERESVSEILLLPLKTARRTARIGKVASGVAVGKNRERLSPLPKHIELKSLVGEQRREEGLMVFNPTKRFFSGKSAPTNFRRFRLSSVRSSCVKELKASAVELSRGAER